MKSTFSLLTVLALAGQLVAQGLNPAQSAQRMKPADGFQVSLVASEPQIRQPVAIDFDERGRLWVMQYLQYPNPAGLKRVGVDRYSRTQYDRVPDPPPRGPRGADKLTIVEPDPARPGAWITRDFVHGLNLASGFAFGHGGVFVLQVPYLLFYPDANRDDVPDSDPEVLLTGFGMEDAHSVANSLTWGPDGWLYGCQGSTVTTRIRGIEFQQGVWRYHPLTHRFELFSEGGGNSWGLDFDRHGHLLYSTNFGPHILLHAAQGGYFWKQFGKHGALHNPHAYGHIDHAPHANPRGGHVTTGGIVYRGGQFPPSLDGAYIAGDLLGHEVLWHKIQPNGSSFRTGLGGVLAAGNDPWFAPCDVCLGPDGCVYIADWHDQRTAHPDPDAEWDRSNGRVFRISYGKPPVPSPLDMGQFTREQLLAELSHVNQWRVRTARRLLAARRDPQMILPLRSKIQAAGNTDLALEYLWALQVCGGVPEAYARELLEHDYAPVRLWAVRLLGDRPDLQPATLSALIALARSEKAILVQRQLACTAQRIPAAAALMVVAGILRHEQTINDPQMPRLLWWAMEKPCVALPESAVTVIQSRVGTTPDDLAVTGYLLERLARRLIAAGTPACDNACIPLASAPAALEGMEKGWQERLVAKGPPATPLLREAVAKLLPSGSHQPAVRLLARMGDPEALREWLSWVADSGKPVPERLIHLESVTGVAPPEEVRALLLRLANAPEPLHLAMLSAWQRVGKASDAARLLAEYAGAPSAVQARLRAVLLSRKDWAGEILGRVKDKKIPLADLSPEEVRVVATFKDDQLDQWVRQLWGTILPPTSEERLAEVRRLNNDLRAAQGDSIRGKALFASKCAVCHKLGGEGLTIGPDLTQANRADTQYLLLSLIDPGNLIRKEYLTHVVETKKGLTLSGIIVAQGAEGVTLVNAKNERLTIAAAEIATLAESPVSLMPENLLKDLSPSQLRDLFAYVQAPHAVGGK
ncbi:MAG: c-type cytochrome [Planctomycetota bacterium]|nr:c-type cytochrome [Planctomycetota bacterium]